MARYQVILAYDGTGFTGSQVQANSRTVQGELERALRNLGWSDRTVIMAGRTDTGVHATGQVAAFDFEWAHSADKLLGALNADLPPDLVVRSLFTASANFHPRFDAVSREYRYRVFFDQIRAPLREKFLWRAWPDVDGDALKQNASIFLGRHDFVRSQSRCVFISHGKKIGLCASVGRSGKMFGGESPTCFIEAGTTSCRAGSCAWADAGRSNVWIT